MSAPRLGAAFLAAALLAACADDARAPLAPDDSAPRLAASPGQERQAAKTSLELIEDDWEGGALDRDNANRYRAYALMAPEKLPSKYRSAARGKDATPSMVEMARDWSALSEPTKKEIRDLRANGFGNLQRTKETTHFVLHYTTQGDWGVPSRDADRNGTPDFIDVAAESWEHIWQREIVQLGYRAPKFTTDHAGNPSQKFHVYYRDLPYYGYCVPENVELESASPVPVGTASGWIVIENDFYGFPANDEDVTGTEVIRSGALKVTQAHEFMHALQFNTNIYASRWMYEAHATWAEDAVYDGVNDWRGYVNSFFRTPDLPLTARNPYGGAFFMQWVTDRGGVDLARRILEATRTQSFADALQSLALGGSWAGIAAFAPAQPTLGVADYATGTSVVPNPRTALLLRATHDAYPVSVAVPAATKQVANGAPWGQGANYVEFLPTGADGTLTLTVDGADGYAWRAYAIVTAKTGGTTTVPIALDGASAGTATIRGFGRTAAKVTLAVTIADAKGVQVPFAYGATLGGAVAN
ncbi:MXAN_6640 family putative metalloprotease [Roseisolibacter sp. H3M3-2]|uniref:MXAN_6640 family putative metalloprotease n=1 Tax=Roseisolibacter sp. H3M3-2 TaxID=3031323 RepID=UPI0023DCD905|nr:MXAN_6640 family putative metalloprotease [Roseisolibacter sp. H3M3-2]MDF1505291.1 hypothetical protein [Roseisolibacter sp. H3M3-2]